MDIPYLLLKSDSYETREVPESQHIWLAAPKKHRIPSAPLRSVASARGGGTCASCEALAERDIFEWWAMFWWHSLLKHWVKHAGRSFQQYGYLIVGTILSLYFTLFAFVEAHHERRMNRALFEQNRFITMAVSGNPGALKAALTRYDKVRNLSAPADPKLWPP